jgi:outer membrane protein assembly factor BamB
MRWIGLALMLCGLWGWARDAGAGSWPQFHGPNATGLANGSDKLPAQIGPDQNVVWKVPFPPGHSSPVVHGDRLYLTGVDAGRLFTFGVDRQTGRILWQAEAPHKGLEKIHQIGSHAQPSPATDGERVVSLFGSSGLFCYDMGGKQLWHVPLGPFKNEFGTGSSPIIVGDWVLLNQDHDADSFLVALDKRTGQTVWKTDRSEFPRGYATPVIWEVNGKKQIVVVGTLRVVGYDFETGKEVWTVRGVARITNATPVVGADGTLFVAAWSPGGDLTERIDVQPFDDVTGQQDADKNGTLESGEITDPAMKSRFPQFDRDKDGHISRAEWENMRRIFADAQNLVLAIKPGGTGDITHTHVLWRQHKIIPYVPSPLYYNGHLFMVKDGGIVSCLDARTGKPAKQERVFGSSGYYSSPVCGDGKVYLVSQRGDLSVITAAPQWEVLGRARFGEDVYATPALADGRIYLRTAGHLYCFAAPPGE